MGIIRASGASLLGGVLVTNSTDDAINASAGLELSFDTEVYDTHGAFNAGVSETTITVPTGISYARFGGLITATGVSSTDTRVAVLKGGSANYAGAGSLRTLDEGGSLIASCHSAIIPVTAGDAFTFFVVTVGDTSITMDGSQSWFSAEWIDFS